MKPALALLAAALLIGGTQAGPGAPQGVSFVKVYRQAEYQKPPSGAWAPAAAGTKLAADDSVRTLNNSYADLQMDPPNRFRLRENSILKVERILSESKDADGTVVRLTDLGILKGEIVALLDKLPAGTRLTLKSPVAIAAVRGTGFSVAVGGDAKTTDVAVASGSVRVEAVGEPDKRVTVNPDQRTTVSPWAGALLRAKGTGLPPRELLLRRLEDPKVPVKDVKDLLERLKNPAPSLARIMIGGEARVTAPADIADAADAEQWARAEARYRAQKGIIDKLETIMLSGNETVGDLMNKDPKICRAILEATNGASVAASDYSTAGRTASVRLEFPLETVRKITGRDMTLAWKGIAPVSLTDYAALFGGFIRAATERAATVDAYRRLAEKIYGTVVNSSTTLKDFAVQNDQVDIAVKGVVQGAGEVSKTYYSDGSIDVTLEIAGAAVKGSLVSVPGLALGEQYMASPAALDADDFIRLLSLDQI